MATKISTKDMSDNTEEANDAPLAGQGNIADAVKKLLKKGKSEMDGSPLRLVADAFLLGARENVEAFDW